MASQIVLQDSSGKPLIEVQPPNGSTALMRVIEHAALDPNFDVAKLQALLDVKERWERDEARKAFEDAMAGFKQEIFVVTKDKTNKQYDSKYTSLGNLIQTVTPFLGKHGLSATWDIDQASGGITVTCILTHRHGHSKRVSMTVPPDKAGAKNPIQEIKSAITYAKGCTFDSVCGTASSDANVDDDGNGAGKRLGDIGERLEWIANCSDLAELEKVFKDSYKAAKDVKDQKGMLALIKAKDARKAELK